MANTKTTKRKPATTDTDGAFVLKLVLYALVGALWVKVSIHDVLLPLPVGILIGFRYAGHEHFQINRKIEYAVLVLAALLGLIAPFGLFIHT